MVGGCHVKPEQFFNLIWGYNDRYAEADSELDPDAGEYYAYFTTVPAGEVWVLQLVMGADVTNAKRIQLRVEITGAAAYMLKDETPAAADQWVLWSGEVVLKEGDRASVRFFSVTAGDDLYWRAWGYKMVISQ